MAELDDSDKLMHMGSSFLTQAPDELLNEKYNHQTFERRAVSNCPFDCCQNGRENKENWPNGRRFKSRKEQMNHNMYREAQDRGSECCMFRVLVRSLTFVVVWNLGEPTPKAARFFNQHGDCWAVNKVDLYAVPGSKKVQSYQGMPVAIMPDPLTKPIDQHICGSCDGSDFGLGPEMDTEAADESIDEQPLAQAQPPPFPPSANLDKRISRLYKKAECDKVITFEDGTRFSNDEVTNLKAQVLKLRSEREEATGLIFKLWYTPETLTSQDETRLAALEGQKLSVEGVNDVDNAFVDFSRENLESLSKDEVLNAFIEERRRTLTLTRRSKDQEAEIEKLRKIQQGLGNELTDLLCEAHGDWDMLKARLKDRNEPFRGVRSTRARWGGPTDAAGPGRTVFEIGKPPRVDDDTLREQYPSSTDSEYEAPQKPASRSGAMKIKSSSHTMQAPVRHSGGVAHIRADAHKSLADAIMAEIENEDVEAAPQRGADTAEGEDEFSDLTNKRFAEARDSSAEEGCDSDDSDQPLSAMSKRRARPKMMSSAVSAGKQKAASRRGGR